LTVGLKSFDDAWLSQGLAEFSAYSLRESLLTGAQLDNMRRETSGKIFNLSSKPRRLSRTPAALTTNRLRINTLCMERARLFSNFCATRSGDQKFNQLLRTFLEQYRGKNASIDDFEKLSTQIAGQPMRYFFARWVEGTGVPEFQTDYQIIRTRAGKFIARGTINKITIICACRSKFSFAPKARAETKLSKSILKTRAPILISNRTANRFRSSSTRIIKFCEFPTICAFRRLPDAALNSSRKEITSKRSSSLKPRSNSTARILGFITTSVCSF
jgi:hypothetical protein